MCMLWTNIVITKFLSDLIENFPCSFCVNIFGGNRRNVLENLKLKLDILIVFFLCWLYHAQEDHLGLDSI